MVVSSPYVTTHEYSPLSDTVTEERTSSEVVVGFPSVVVIPGKQFCSPILSSLKSGDTEINSTGKRFQKRLSICNDERLKIYKDGEG